MGLQQPHDHTKKRYSNYRNILLSLYTIYLKQQIMKKLIFTLSVLAIITASCKGDADTSKCEAHAKNCPKAENCPEHPECEAHEKCAKSEDCKEHPACEAFEHKA